MDGESDGAFTVGSSSAGTPGPTVAERSITTPRLCTEIIEDSLLGVADSERAGLQIVGRTLSQVTDMRVHLEAMPGRLAGSLAVTGALKAIEASQATGDSPAANEAFLGADQARRALVPSAAAAVANRVDSLRMRQGMLHQGMEYPGMEASVGRMAAATLAVDTLVVATAAVEVTVVADTVAGAERSL